MALIDAQLSWARLMGRKGQWEQVVQILEPSYSTDRQNNAAGIYYLSHAYFNLGNFIDALPLNVKALDLEPQNTSWRKRLASTFERCSRHQEAAEQWTILSEGQPNAAEWHFRLAKTLLRLKKVTEALDELRLATSLEPSAETYTDELARVLRTRKIYWEEVKLRESSSFESSATQEHDHGTALMLMNRYPEACPHFERALRENPKNADWAYDAGHAHEMSGNVESATHFYAKAIKNDRKLEAAKYGIGVFHEKRGDWHAAALCYKAKADADFSNGPQQYKAGLAYDRCFLWEEAARYYERAIVADPSVGRWHYKLGLSSERTEDWARAAQAYGYAANKFNNEYWSFRCGLSQLALGEYENAFNSFQKSCKSFAGNILPTVGESDDARSYLDSLAATMTPPAKRSRTIWFKNRGLLHFQAGKFELAASDFRMAVAGATRHDRDTYFMLGVSLSKLGDFAGAAQSLRETRIFKWQDGINVDKLTKNPNTKNLMEYAEYYLTLKIDENQVLWQSNGGDSIGCNPLALYEAMANDERYSAMRHIWVLNDDQTPVPSVVSSNPNVIFTRRHSDGYRRALATSKYLANNATFPGYFIRRDQQRYLNTWHGTPYKTLGKDMKGEPFKHAAFVRDMLQASHLISPNSHTTSVLLDSHDIRGLYQGRMAELGSPRVDRTLNASSERVEEIRKALGALPGQKLVLFAPTWRGSSNKAVSDIERLQSDLNRMSEVDAKLVFRAHRLEEETIKSSNIDATIVPQAIDSNELLAAVDVLVTDYSSIFFDYLPLKRPVVFYMPDQIEYEEERGLYLSNEELPGTIATTIDEAIRLVTLQLSTEVRPSAQSEAALTKFCESEDGKASQRVLDFWVRDVPLEDEIDLRDDRKTILFQQSMIPTGMSASFLNLVSKLDPEHFQVVLLVEPRLIADDAGRLETISRLPNHVQVIGRSGGRVMTPEQSWVNSVMENRYRLPSEAMENTYFESYSHEFRRIFGKNNFDAIVQFDGYVPFWGGLLAAGGTSATRRVTYLHNDMEEERTKRWPNLESVFGQYARFDKLISVSATMSSINCKNITKSFNIDSEKFIACENVINGQKIIEQSKDDIDEDLQHIFNNTETVFVSSGRLSIEKDHKKLISAFKKHVKSFPSSHLLILGDGPLRAELSQQIEEDGLGLKVTLAGRRPNPYPYVRAADCFVLPSNHEGQPMVLLEAMVLGKKIVVTDIPGSAHVVKNQYGLIVHNSIDGLVSGLESYELDTVPYKTFDWEEYEKDTVESFLESVGLRD